MANEPTVGYETRSVSVSATGQVPGPIGGTGRDSNDHSALRHGREKHVGTSYSKFTQPPPMLFTADGHNCYHADMYRGSVGFLIASGPSFGELLKTEVTIHGKKMSAADALKHPGCVTIGVNNSARTFRPNLWTCVDDPGNFIKSIWLDPKIAKFVPFAHADKFLFDNERWQDMPQKVRDCPNMWYFRRNEKFDAEQFLTEDTFNWGNHKDFGGGRSVFLVAVRLMYLLGIRKLYLLGVDLKMSETDKYHFAQNRSESSIKGNNATYKSLIDRFAQLRPKFDAEGFQVFNCNPDSALTAFEFVKFQDALTDMIAHSDIPDITNERTEGLYDRRADLEKKNKEKAKKAGIKADKAEGVAKQLEASKTNYSQEVKLAVKKDLDEARAALDAAKKHLKEQKESKPTDAQDLERWKLEVEDLEKLIVLARKEFKARERKKNLVWFGTEVVTK